MSRGYRPTYRLIRPGCATSMLNCPNGDSAVTVQPLDSKGRDKPGGTVCTRSDVNAEFVR